MKKIYIKPETIVVALNVRDNVMNNTSPVPGAGSGNAQQGGGPGGDSGDGFGREVIQSPDAWEEW